jgi:hypothetical protein
MTRRPASVLARNTAGFLVLALVGAGCSGGSSEPDPVVASVEVTPNSASRKVGETVQLGAAVKDASGTLLSGQSVTWTSSANNIASVSASGLVTAAALGSATITASAGAKSGTATITVIPEPIASIAVTPVDDTLLAGETVQLAVTMRDAGGAIVTDRQVTWSSTSPNVASVSNSGLVTAVDDGVATISASADGRSATATIRVLGPCNTALAPVITVGQTINGTLSTTDCQLGDDTYADGYALSVTTATNVQIDMTASYDTYLFLLELTAQGLVQRAANDDVDPDDPNDPSDPVNINSRITFNLQAGAQYFILANSFDPNVTGDYVLKVAAVTSFIAQQGVTGKAGKAPIAKLLQPLKIGIPR